MRRTKYFLLGFLIMVASIALVAYANTPAYARGRDEDFVQLSLSLTRLHVLGIMQGNYNQGVTFNEDLARKEGFSEQEIVLGKQIVEVTNILINQSKASQAEGKPIGVDRLSLDLQHFPELKRFWDEAAQMSIEDKQSVAGEFLQSRVEPLGTTGISHWVCGYCYHPVPAHAAPWHTYHSSNAASTLRSWGYHPTPSWAGGGWTRPQTYNWWLCGWSTYRDHAYIYPSTTINEQNYTGAVPGEPNPEVWRSGPWPYPDWPAYVWWWHRTH